MHTHTHIQSSPSSSTIFFSVLAFLSMFFSLTLFSVETSHAQENPEISGNTSFENSEFFLDTAGGDFQKPTSFTLTPKNQKKIHWSFLRNNPSNLHSTTEATRIFVPKTRNFYIFSDASAIEKFTFKIHTQVENRFFRIQTIDANPEENFLPTITVENASSLPFSFSMKGWKISGENFEIDLPDEELEPGEKRTFIANLKNPEISKFSEVTLISPTKRVRDRVKFSHLKNTEIFTRKNTSPETRYSSRDTRPEFFIIEKTLSQAPRVLTQFQTVLLYQSTEQ